MNLFCTKKNINGIKVCKYTIKIKISFEANVLASSPVKADNIKPKNNNTIIAKNSSNSTNSTNLIIKNNIVANKISDATENSIISPNLVKLLYVLFFILKLLSDKTIIIKKIIEDNILLLIIILDLKNSSIAGISSFNGAEVNMPSKNKSKNDKNVISIVLLLIFSKLLSIINKNE
ncbi:hypothetical protein DJ52_10615 [Brachyspira murdochii]|uniref:Uncharacterized protein n=1 Tax=Brachyspira murdochii TaxID=84378 RepID=A0ABX5B2S5_9SPIR|nr:hypothetical protein DJ52_10615 [Brachyspira murdochii]